MSSGHYSRAPLLSSEHFILHNEGLILHSVPTEHQYFLRIREPGMITESSSERLCCPDGL